MQRQLAGGIALIAAALALVIGASLLWNHVSKKPAIGAAMLPCFNGKYSTMNESCMRGTIRNLLGTYSTAELMSYIVATTSPQLIVAQCHVVAHDIGEETLLKTGSLESALNACTQDCSYGCVHGALGSEVAKDFGETYPDEDIAHADTKEILAVGKKYCDRGWILCHGIGHIIRIAADSLTHALQTCDAVSSSKDRSNACYRGVFMEDNGVTSFTHTASSTPPDYGYPCDVIPLAYTHACYMQLTDYQIRRFEALKVPQNQRFAITTGACDSLSAARRYDCFYGLGYKLDRNLNKNGSLQNNGRLQCERFAAPDAAACILGLAVNYSSFSRYSDLIALCDAQTPPLQQSCYQTGFSSLPDVPGAMEKACVTSGSAICSAQFASYSRTDK